MREYGRIAPTFWTGDTGKLIKKAGPEAVIVAVYLMTSPMSNMLGMYYQPLLYAAHETGLGIDGASKGLIACVDAGFCDYDRETEMVWVKEMAHYQISKKLKADDKRCLGIQKDYNQLPDNPFLGDFFDYYCSDFHLKDRRNPRSERRAFDAPPKQLTGTGTGAGKAQAQAQAQDLSPASAGEGTFVQILTSSTDLLGQPVQVQSNGSGKRQRSPVDFEGVVGLYHEMLTPPLPAVEKLTDKRRGQIRQRWSDDLPTLDSWRAFFADVAQSQFLMGKVPGRDGRPPFRADLEWLTNSTNFTAIAEGKYHR